MPASSNNPFVRCSYCETPHNCPSFDAAPHITASALIEKVHATEERPKAVVGLLRSKAQPELVLVVSRRVDGGRYGLPGGKVESGETLEQALSREMAEEIGIVLRESRQIYAAPTRRHLTHVFEVLAYDGLPRSLENESVQWVDYHRLLDSSFCFYAEWYRHFFTATGLL
jgi:8-oxo-dGTP diphosphatase